MSYGKGLKLSHALESLVYVKYLAHSLTNREHSQILVIIVKNVKKRWSRFHIYFNELS